MYSTLTWVDMLSPVEECGLKRWEMIIISCYLDVNGLGTQFLEGFVMSFFFKLA
jgi:hypothetical protein